MTAAATFRLAIWREWRARWGLHAIAAATAALAPLFPERIASGWSLFALAMVLPALLCFAAAGGGAAPDAFWRGLGGPAWARALGAPAVHLVGFGLPIVALIPAGEVDPLGYGAVVFALYGTVRAARAVVAGVPVLVGPLLGVALLAASVFVGDRLALWGLGEALGVRLVALGLLGAALAPWLDARFGVWGAGVKRGAGRLVAGVLLLSVAAGAAAEVATGAFAEAGALVEDLDTGRVLRVRWRGRAYMANAWLTLEEGGAERDLGPGEEGSLGPNGAWAVDRAVRVREGDSVRSVGTVLELGGPRGSRSCPVEAEAGCWRWTWRDDGDAVAVGCGDDTWIVDLRAGCERLADASVGWLGARRVVAHDGVVTLGGSEVGRLPDDVLVLARGGVAVASALYPGARRAWRIDDAGLHPIFDGREARAYLARDAVCARGDGLSTCWRADGTLVQAAGRFVDLAHVVDGDDVVTRLADGRRWTLPEGTRGRLRVTAAGEVLVSRGGEVVRVEAE